MESFEVAARPWTAQEAPPSREGGSAALTEPGATVERASPPPAVVRASRYPEVDAATVARACQGERAALEALVRHYQRPVFAFISRSCGAGPHVEDLAQETFLRVCRALPRYETRGAKFSTWVFQIAVRLIQDRRKRFSPVLLELEGRDRADWGDMEQACDARRELTRVERLASELPEEQRWALVLVEFHGQSIEDAARILECAPGTIKSRVSRARERLRAGLNKRGEP